MNHIQLEGKCVSIILVFQGLRAKWSDLFNFHAKVYLWHLALGPLARRGMIAVKT
jgi:hypothetical protein